MKVRWLSVAAILIFLALPVEPAFAATINCTRNPVSTDFSCDKTPSVNDTANIKWKGPAGACTGTVTNVDLTDGLMDIKINTAGCDAIAAGQTITANFSVGCDSESDACQVPEFTAPAILVAALAFSLLAFSRRGLLTRTPHG